MNLSAESEEGFPSSKRIVHVETEEQKRSTSPVPSCSSMMSDHSMGPPINFSSDPGVHQKKTVSPVSSCVSLMSNMSIDAPYNFSKKNPLSLASSRRANCHL
ncbi:hypothetical protein UPYG_G00265540 [Umbra pygmaea]|uniref:Uncharacterized protein n=1 Tax=Umbra pygmaea TaxID=75934 RepID=A0ABD0WEH4_UMBPY